MFILRRLQEEYHAKGKGLYLCFIYRNICILKAYDRIPRTFLGWAMMENGITEVLVSLFSGAKTKISVNFKLS